MTGKAASLRGPQQVAHAAALRGAGRWLIDAERSSLQISVKVGFVATVSGRFTEVRGALELAGDPLSSTIAVEVPTRSLTSGSSHWDSVLLNAGLIDSTANPTIAFASTALAENNGGWCMFGLLVTERGCLPVSFQLVCLSETVDRMRFRATGSLAARDAVRLLSQPGVERLIGKTMTVDLVVEAVPAGN